MNKEQIITSVKQLKLPKGHYVVFGSAPLAIHAIRPAGDIDMLVSTELLEELAAQGWKKIHKGDKDEPLTLGDFEAHDSWDFSSYSPTLEELLSRPKEIDGIDFASLEDVKKWKVASGRPKDFKDVEMIDEYLAE